MSSDGPLPWNAELVASGTAGTRFAGRIQHLQTVSSTNTLAIQAAHAGAPEGHVWVAGEQTAGRGRGGHIWHSEPRSGLYLSVLLRPSLPPARALHLSLAAGLAVQFAIEQTTGCRPDLRWPNDLLLDERKFGGILVETAVDPASGVMRQAVLGIGINVGHTVFPKPLRPLATSILLSTGRTLPHEALLVEVLLALDRELSSLEASPSEILDRFAAASTWVRGKHVHVGEEEGYTGVTAGLDPRGFLLVQTGDATIRTVLSGSVRAAGT